MRIEKTEGRVTNRIHSPMAESEPRVDDRRVGGRWVRGQQVATETSVRVRGGSMYDEAAAQGTDKTRVPGKTNGL